MSCTRATLTLVIAALGVVASGCAGGPSAGPVILADGSTQAADEEICFADEVVDPPPEEAVHEGVETGKDRGFEYGGSTPETILEWLADGRDDVTGKPAEARGEEAREKEEEKGVPMSRLRDDVREGRAKRTERTAQGPTGSEVKFTNGTTTVIVVEVADRWFPKEYVWPATC